jgi:N-acetylmuramoyl-L-alanine amidase
VLEQINYLPKLKKIIIRMQSFVSKTYIKRIPILLTLVFTIALGLSTQKIKAQKINTVVIDAGHGGRDPGAIANNCKEKDIALAIALQLGEYIKTEFPDIKIIYTRQTDNFVELKERAEIANRNNADLMISIHVNSAKNSTIYGASTYVMGLGKSDDNLYVAGLENSALRFETEVETRYNDFKEDTMPTHIVNSLVQTKNLENSLIFAKLVQDQFRKRVGRKDLGIRQDNLVVLWYTMMPSILVETGFISNPNEARYLSSKQGQEFMASGIFRAFRDYKIKYEGGKATVKTVQTTKFAPIDVAFYVQIRSSISPITAGSSEFKGIIGVKELQYSGRYNYVVGPEYDLTKATIKQNEIRKKIPDAYLIATKNGKIISINEAKKLISAN